MERTADAANCTATGFCCGLPASLRRPACCAEPLSNWLQVGKDKDGVAASAVFAELAADVYARGATLAQHWQQLQQQYGGWPGMFGCRVCEAHAVCILQARLNCHLRRYPFITPD